MLDGKNNFLTTSSWELILLKYEILVILGGNEEEFIAGKEFMFAPGLAAPGWKCIPEHEHKFHHPYNTKLTKNKSRVHQHHFTRNLPAWAMGGLPCFPIQLNERNE